MWRVKEIVSLYLGQPLPWWHSSGPKETFSASSFSHGRKWEPGTGIQHPLPRPCCGCAGHCQRPACFLPCPEKRCAQDWRTRRGWKNKSQGSLRASKDTGLTKCVTYSIRKLIHELLGNLACRPLTPPWGPPTLLHIPQLCGCSLCTSPVVVRA